MASRLDYRDHPEAVRLRRQLPEMRHRPLVGASELREIVRVFDALPRLEYPISSAGELIDKLGDGEPLPIAGVDADPVYLVKRMPAYYFPIWSPENFTEKIAELLRENRKRTDVPKELESIKRQLPDLEFPVESPEHLREMLGRRSAVWFQDTEIGVEEALQRVEGFDFFPLRSQEDFDRKVAALMASREIVVGHNEQ